nr:hypothetical protein [uncultured Cellulosilyticum sp.]
MNGKSCDTCLYQKQMFCERYGLILCQLVAGCPSYIAKDGKQNDEQVESNRKREIEGYLGSLPR